MSGSKEQTQVKATIITGDNKVEKRFKVDVEKDSANNSTHLNSLANCVNRLQTQLNQYLTQIIDDENASQVTTNDDNSSKQFKEKDVKQESSDHCVDDNQTEEPKQKKCKNK